MSSRHVFQTGLFESKYENELQECCMSRRLSSTLLARPSSPPKRKCVCFFSRHSPIRVHFNSSAQMLAHNCAAAANFQRFARNFIFLNGKKKEIQNLFPSDRSASNACLHSSRNPNANFAKRIVHFFSFPLRFVESPFLFVHLRPGPAMKYISSENFEKE